MAFIRFMNGTAGRLLRIVVGLALILVGLLVVGGTGGIVMAVIGVAPLVTGIFNICVLGPAFGAGLSGRARAS
jgi:hypothetical protein